MNITYVEIIKQEQNIKKKLTNSDGQAVRTDIGAEGREEKKIIHLFSVQSNTFYGIMID